LPKLIEIISVGKAESAADLGSMVERWELRVKTYEAEMMHVLDGHIKAAALLGMCPHDLQDFASPAIKKPDDHAILRDVIRTYVCPTVP
jgi:hypothetical protein